MRNQKYTDWNTSGYKRSWKSDMYRFNLVLLERRCKRLCLEARDAIEEGISAENKRFNWFSKDRDGEKPGKSTAEMLFLADICKTNGVQ